MCIKFRQFANKMAYGSGKQIVHTHARALEKYFTSMGKDARITL